MKSRVEPGALTSALSFLTSNVAFHEILPLPGGSLTSGLWFTLQISLLVAEDMVG
jgi:hypothetical protein